MRCETGLDYIFAPGELVGELPDPFNEVFRVCIIVLLQLDRRPNIIRIGLLPSVPVRPLLVKVSRTCPSRLMSLALLDAPESSAKLLTSTDSGSPHACLLGMSV